MSNTLVQLFLVPLSPVLAMLTAALSLIFTECFPKFPLVRTKLTIALLGSLISLGLCIWLMQGDLVPLSLTEGQTWLVEFTKTFRWDSLTLSVCTSISLFTLISIVVLNFQFPKAEIRGEIFALTLFIACGMMLLASADSLLMVFMALELLSLPTYALVGIQRRDRASSEASLKYFLFGSFATVLLVFGIALLYAQFGTLSIPRLAEAMRSVDLSTLSSQALVYGGLVLLIVAIGFKVGLVPFHMWLPDAYQGAPTAVTGFMGSAIKLAGFAMAVRVLWGIFLPLAQTWSNGLAVLAVITMFVGNIAALVQDNLKRMFAYSSVSHAGYLMLGVSGVLANGRPSFESLNYYLVVYGLMFLGLFGILTLLDKETRSTDIFHVSGLGFTHPLLGFLFSLFALSAAGIPPTAGFFAKYFVFMDVVKAGKTWFVVLALISSLIGIFYYLRVLVFLYMREPKEALNLRRGGFFMFAALILCATILVYLSIKPQLYY